jgi:hypothetical protein
MEGCAIATEVPAANTNAILNIPTLLMQIDH